MDISPGRRAAWIALADQFLDTETRYLIPSAALRCVEAGLAREARDIWRHEVFPVVGHNLFEVAGEWALWPEEWLVDQITAQRDRPRCLAGLVHRACARICCRVYEDRWTAIDRCILLLERAPQRRRTAADLEFLARVYFDFCPPSCSHMSADRTSELRRLYETEFLAIFCPLVVPGDSITAESVRICAARVDTALSPSR
jgi:hypothetical protein